MSELSARLDRLPFTRFHRRLLIVGGSGYLFDAMDVAIIGFVLPMVVAQWHLSGGEAGTIAGASAIVPAVPLPRPIAPMRPVP